MKLAADLHMHSCASPCGDELMTPNNIVGMAKLKGLDVIAVSDHNCARNLPAIKLIADAYDILLIPAIEAESREEVHMLCYMPSVEAALSLGEKLYASLPDTPNMPDFFGEQAVMNDDDEQTDTIKKILIQSTSYELEELASLCREHGGVPVPAHINKSSNSLINNLGFVPPGADFTTVEVFRGLPVPDSVELSRYHVLYSSDAHDLGSIFERDNFINVEEKSVEAVLAYMRSKKGQ